MASPLIKNYHRAKYDAKRRGIGFQLTYKEWYGIWEASGHLSERGTAIDQYHMARFGDKGPYVAGNVKIITHRENTAERKFTALTHLKMSAAQRGNKKGLGHYPTLEHRVKLSAARKLYWQRWREARA